MTTKVPLFGLCLRAIYCGRFNQFIALKQSTPQLEARLQFPPELQHYQHHVQKYLFHSATINLLIGVKFLFHAFVNDSLRSRIEKIQFLIITHVIPFGPALKIVVHQFLPLSKSTCLYLFVNHDKLGTFWLHESVLLSYYPKPAGNSLIEWFRPNKHSI